MAKHGIGLIGLGNIANTYRAAIESLDNAYISAVFTHNAEKGKKFPGAKVYTDFDLFLKDKDTESVIIATPSGTHASYASKCMEAGKHCLVEKPLDLTMDKCNAMCECAKKNNVILSGIFQSRYYESVKAVKKAVDSGRLGKLVMAGVYARFYRPESYYTDVAWRGTKEFDGGCLMNQGSHGVDLLLHFAGPVKEVKAFKANREKTNIECEDTLISSLLFENGALGTIEISTSCYPGTRRRIELSGTEGLIVLEDEAITTWKFKNPQPGDDDILKKYALRTEFAETASSPVVSDFQEHAAQIKNFLEAIEGKTSVDISGQEASKAVDLICRIHKSIE